jgi:hypothetical protein
MAFIFLCIGSKTTEVFSFILNAIFVNKNTSRKQGFKLNIILIKLFLVQKKCSRLCQLLKSMHTSIHIVQHLFAVRTWYVGIAKFVLKCNFNAVNNCSVGYIYLHIDMYSICIYISKMRRCWGFQRFCPNVRARDWRGRAWWQRLRVRPGFYGLLRGGEWKIYERMSGPICKAYHVCTRTSAGESRISDWK